MTTIFEFKNKSDRDKTANFLLRTLPEDEQSLYSVVYGETVGPAKKYTITTFSTFVANELMLFCISNSVYCQQVINYMCDGAAQYDEAKLITELLCYGTYLTDFNTHDVFPKHLTDAHRVLVIKHDVTGDIYWLHKYNGDVVELTLLK